jgi:hypothetical protein
MPSSYGNLVNDGQSQMVCTFYGSLIFSKALCKFMGENHVNVKVLCKFGVHSVAGDMPPPPLKNLFSALFDLEFWL